MVLLVSKVRKRILFFKIGRMVLMFFGFLVVVMIGILVEGDVFGDVFRRKKRY